MEVHLDLYGPFREAVGEKRVTREVPEGTTVGELLSALIEDHPGLADGPLADGSIAPSATVTVEGTPVARDEGVETRLSPGDVVRVSPAIKGGGR